LLSVPDRVNRSATAAHDFSPPDIFISYSRGDGRAFAEAFEERIAKAGLTSWRDLRSVEGGEDIRPQVLSAIEAVEHLVLILTRRALASDWVRREWMHARAHGVKVSPVLADPTIRRSELPAWARRADIYDIAEPERWEKLVLVLKGPGQTRRVPYMAGALPPSFVERTGTYEALKKHVLAPASGPVALTTALQGAGGYGKSTLANALCHDEDVRFAFSDGIIRIEIGKERASVLGLIVDVLEKLDPDGKRPGFQDEKIAGEHLAQVLGEAHVLLVIDDVWRESQLAPFLLGGPNHDTPAECPAGWHPRRFRRRDAARGSGAPSLLGARDGRPGVHGPYPRAGEAARTLGADARDRQWLAARPQCRRRGTGRCAAQAR
jgi:hypothetical protein